MWRRHSCLPGRDSELLMSPRNFDAPRNQTGPLLHKNQVLLATCSSVANNICLVWFVGSSSSFHGIRSPETLLDPWRKPLDAPR